MRPIFLAGTGRSGTTVARRALSRHPQVAAMPGELRLIADPDGLLDCRDALARRWDPYAGDRALRRLETMLTHMTAASTDRYRHHNTDAWVGADWYRDRVARLVDDLRTGVTPGTWTGAPPGEDGMWETVPGTKAVDPALRAFADDLYRRRNAAATRWVEDTPYTGCHWRRVRAVWPEATLVLCVRDVRDVLASYLRGRQRWTPKDPGTAAQRIAAVIHRTDAEMVMAGGDVVTLRLERVLEDPEREVARLCGRLGLDPSPDMAAAYDGDRAHVGRWRTELTAGDVRTLERAVGAGAWEAWTWEA